MARLIALRAAVKTDGPAVVTILAYSGGVLRLAGWGPTVIDLAGLKLSHDVPLLTDHENSVDSLAGHGTPVIQNNQLFIRGEIARDSTAGKKVLALARGNVTLSASVGIGVEAEKEISNGESVTVNGRQFKADSRGLAVITSSTLDEVSFVPIGADADAPVLSLAAKGKTMSRLQADHDPQLTAELDACAKEFNGREAALRRLRAEAPVVNVDETFASDIRATIENAELLNDSLVDDLRLIEASALRGEIDALEFEQRMDRLRKA